MSLKNFLLLCFLVASPVCLGEKIELRMNFEVTEEGLALRDEETPEFSVGDTASAVFIYDDEPAMAPSPLGIEPSMWLRGDSLTIQVGSRSVTQADPIFFTTRDTIKVEARPSQTLFLTLIQDELVPTGDLPTRTGDLLFGDTLLFQGNSFRDPPEVRFDLFFSSDAGYRLTDYSITTIPEPVAFSSLSLVGGILLCVRRRRGSRDKNPFTFGV